MSQEIATILSQFALNHVRIYRWAKDNKGKYIYCNDEMAKDAGLQKEEDVVNLTDFDLFPRYIARPFIANDNEVLATRNPQIYIEQGYSINKEKFESHSFKMINTGRSKKILGTIGNGLVFPSRLLKQKTKIEEHHLTKRQLECLTDLTKGMTSKQIAHSLNLSSRTVEHYLEILKNKFNCHSKFQLIQIAFSLDAVKHEILLRS